jgi:hypothetical protein
VFVLRGDWSPRSHTYLCYESRYRTRGTPTHTHTQSTPGTRGYASLPSPALQYNFLQHSHIRISLFHISCYNIMQIGVVKCAAYCISSSRNMSQILMYISLAQFTQFLPQLSQYQTFLSTFPLSVCVPVSLLGNGSVCTLPQQ